MSPEISSLPAWHALQADDLAWGYKTYFYQTLPALRATQLLPAANSIVLRLSSNMLEGNTGCYQWDAGFLLGAFILNQPHLFSGKEFHSLPVGTPKTSVFWQWMVRTRGAIAASVPGCCQINPLRIACGILHRIHISFCNFVQASIAWSLVAALDFVGSVSIGSVLIKLS